MEKCPCETDPQKTSVASAEKRVSQWEVLMRKFSEAHKDECKAVTLDIPRVKRAEKIFPTGSSYNGTWDVLGMSGYGTYKLPNGVIYEGEFDDGTFHGQGELRYPCGAVIFGKWVHGEMVERTLVFPDGQKYAEEDWPYCTMPDRRFTVEINNGLQPAGRSYLTADQPTREIPPGFYDTGDGFFDPEVKIVFSADEPTRIVRKPQPPEQQWIVENCRTNPIKTLGPRRDLYEEWSEPLTVPQADELAGISEPSFTYSRSMMRMIVEDKDSGADPCSKDCKTEHKSTNFSWKNLKSVPSSPDPMTARNSRGALTQAILTCYDDFPIEYIEEELQKKN